MYWGEVAAAPTDVNFAVSVTSVAFDGQYELVWAGTAAGRLLTFSSPDLSLCSYWPGHTHAVLGLNPLPGSDLCLSVSADSAVLCNSGGVKRSGYSDPTTQLLCASLEPGAAAARVALLGSAAGSITQLDLATGKTSIAVSSGVLLCNMAAQCQDVYQGEGVSILRPCPGRGLLAAATSSGKLLLTDPRNNWKVDPSCVFSAHSGGVSCLDVKDSRVATCGCSMRGTTPIPEPFIKVFDMRGSLLRPLLQVFDMRGSLLRPLLTIPFSGPSGSPTCLTFHAQLPSVLLVGCSRGGLAVADTGVGAVTANYQAETGGGAVTSCMLSSVGEAWAMGDMLGCVRLWSETAAPRVHAMPTQLQVPPQAPPQPAVQLEEWDSFAQAQKPPLDLAAGSRLLSDMDRHVMMSVGLPPRIIEPTLLQSVKQVDFVGHLANPYYVRGEKYGLATAKVAALRNKRLELKIPSRHKQDVAAQKAERSRKHQAEGGTLLPNRFHRVEIRAQSGLKFEEFDFSFYNRTRFAGLENDLPNAYANALLQVLYFIPELRAALLANHVPEPDTEFCLACELALLFRMMVTSHGGPCQAANLLRALRQVREAAALGLLDSSSVVSSSASAPGAASDAAVSAHHDTTGLTEWSLSRRCAALSRFLLDTLAREGGQPKPTQAGVPPPRSGIPQPAPGNASLSGLLDHLFGIRMTQRLQCLSGPMDADGQRPHRMRESRIMQAKSLRQIMTAWPCPGASGRQRSPSRSPSSPELLSQSVDLTLSWVKSIVGHICWHLTVHLETCSTGASSLKDALRLAMHFVLHVLDPLKVELVYPLCSTKAARIASDVGKFGFNKLPQAAANALGLAGQPSRPSCSPDALGYLGSPTTPTSMQPHPASLLDPGTPTAGMAHSPVSSPIGSPVTPVLTPRSKAPLAAAPGTPTAAAHHISFAEVLEASLCSSQDTRAWFDDTRGYAMVRQTRLPTNLPQVLAISCAVSEPADVEWWLPEMKPVQAPDGTIQLVEGHHLPWALRVEVSTSDWRVRVRQGNSAWELAQLPSELHASNQPYGQPQATFYDACYELTAVVAQVRDALEEPLSAMISTAAAVSTSTASGGMSAGTPSVSAPRTPTAASAAARSSGTPVKVQEGHLVAMIRVPQSYASEAPVQCPCVAPPIGAGSPPPQPPTIMPKRSSAHKELSSRRPQQVMTTPISRTSLPGMDVVEKVDLLDLSGLPSVHIAGTSTMPAGVTSAGLSMRMTEHSNGSMLPGAGSPAQLMQDVLAAAQVPARGAAAAAAGTSSAPAMTSPSEHTYSSMGSSNGHGGGVTGAEAADGQSPGEGPGLDSSLQPSSASQVQEGWLLFNDFSVSPLLPHEVLSVYGGQKLPCLLHYRRVDGPSTAAPEGDITPKAQPLAPTIAPVLTAAEFAQLCRAPPLQGSSAHLEPARFKPLDMSTEAPRPGMLLALDAEFVMVSAPEKLVDANLEVLTRQSRLSLGRVSVLRGEGPASGTACIDDYVRVVEPVLDYLTRYSGLMPGDLEPSTSRHHLTTMKHAYLKLRSVWLSKQHLQVVASSLVDHRAVYRLAVSLRYLVDKGCVFVGHGLKKDFRIINLTVPPQQLVDTVELYSRWRQRKMSLRFLASYLLGAHIQSSVHDSIEDACTALRLYELYKQLVDNGTFQAKLVELYAWGARYGWEPVMLDRQGNPIPPAPTTPAATSST